MSNYFDKREYFLEHIWFRYDGIVYRGSGVLRWRPEKGVRIVAKIHGEKFPARKEFRSIDFKEPRRMYLKIAPRGNKIIAITPLLSIDDMALHFAEPFASNFRRIIFFENLSESQRSKEKWFGSAMYEANQGLDLPDTVYKETKIGNGTPRQGFSSTALEYSGSNGEHVVGEMRDDKYLYFHWSLPKEYWTKQRSWRFSEALQDALSIVSGKIVQLRYHETDRNHRVAKEYNANGEPSSLGQIFRFFDYHFVEKNLVIHLAQYLSQESGKEKIIRKILWQTIDASKQNSQEAKELLLSTILEAALRTLYELPFIPGKKDTDLIPKLLKKFQSEYLTGSYNDKWGEAIIRVTNAYKRLRNRNAHPDWSTLPMGMLSVSKLEEAINDMILLSRFYGYMILALSGLKDIEPAFPAPASKWGPLMVMEVGQPE